MFFRIKNQTNKKTGKVYRYLYQEERIYRPGRRPQCKSKCLGRAPESFSGWATVDEMMTRYPGQTAPEDRYVPKPEVTPIEKVSVSQSVQPAPSSQSQTAAPASAPSSEQGPQGDPSSEE